MEGRPVVAEKAVDQICMRYYYALASTSRINRLSGPRQLHSLLFSERRLVLVT